MSFVISERLAGLAAEGEAQNETATDAAIVDAFANQHARVDAAYGAYVNELVRLDAMIEADSVAVQYSIERDSSIVRFVLAGGQTLDVPTRQGR